ncbi:MAG TPA: hypothetical protein VGC06_00800, partial [Actinomycetes bacterium]
MRGGNRRADRVAWKHGLAGQRGAVRAHRAAGGDRGRPAGRLHLDRLAVVVGLRVGGRERLAASRRRAADR